MSADDLTASTSEPDFDLDEDLFNFDEIALGSIDDDDEADLSEVFATLDDDELEDDLDFDPPDPIAETETASAPGTPAEPALAKSALQPVAAAPVDPIAAAPVPASAGVAVAPLVPAAPMVVQAGGFPKSVLWIFLAITSVNLLLAVVFFSASSGMRGDMVEMQKDIRNVVEGGAAELTTAQGQLRNVTTPEVSPSPDNHPVFALALEDIEAGKFTKARQRLYALLSVVDRMDPADRDKVEARANYLIAHAWQLEVVTRTEGDR